MTLELKTNKERLLLLLAVKHTKNVCEDLLKGREKTDNAYEDLIELYNTLFFIEQTLTLK